ncbi:MAG: OPT/YSL family transporter [Candidatus Hodarchaeota archaeon]
MSMIEVDSSQLLHESPLKEEISSKADRIQKKVIFFSVLIGLFLNWISLYLTITLGFLSLGISVFFILLLAKLFLRDNIDNKNLAVVAISYGGVAAAEASIGLLLLIWLSQNASIFGLSGKMPSWLIPSSDVIANRIIFSKEWLIPIAVHYFIMLVPGIAGIIFGLYIKDRFIHDDDKYPFPTVIQSNEMLDVLVTNQTSKIKLFRIFLVIGFVIGLFSLLIPAIDLSQPQNGWILGLNIGAVGIALFAVGFIINKPNISVVAATSSFVFYVILAPILVKDSFNDVLKIGMVSNDYYDFYTFALQTVFLSFLLGFLLSTVIAVPVVWNFAKKVLKTGKNDEKDVSAKIANDEDEKNEISSNNEVSNKKSNRTRKTQVIYLLCLSFIYLLCVSFIYFSGVLGSNLLIIAVVVFWILIIGTIITGILATESIAKTSTAIVPPFIFDMIPLFLSGARGITPYVATPKAEVGETIATVRNAKFAKAQGLSMKTMMGAYLIGYLPAIITTPFFALLLWDAFGIGTSQLPAPSFPILAAFIAPFAAGSITSILNLEELVIGGITALFFGPGVAIGFAFGVIFPPHMAFALAFGGVTRIILNKKLGKEKIEEQGTTAATALAVGGSLTIPLLILKKLFFV